MRAIEDGDFRVTFRKVENVEKVRAQVLQVTPALLETLSQDVFKLNYYCDMEFADELSVTIAPVINLMDAQQIAKHYFSAVFGSDFPTGRMRVRIEWAW